MALRKRELLNPAEIMANLHYECVAIFEPWIHRTCTATLKLLHITRTYEASARIARRLVAPH